MMPYMILFLTTILQSASFTLVSRARNSSSIVYHASAAALSNIVWLLVIRQVLMNLDSITMMAIYVLGSVVGSVLMHWVSMRYIEKGKRQIGTR